MKLFIGTSGYSYQDWRGNFYPDKLQKGDMLSFYSGYFDCVEVNSTYYAIPNQFVFKRMEEKTPPEFEFVVKVNQETTHRRGGNHAVIDQLIDVVQPLVEKEKFSGFLAQFPYSFKNTPQNRSYLLRMKEKFADYPLFVEFRNWTWVRPEIYHMLSENRIDYVNVDEPRLRGLIKPQDITTGKRGYIRFHGRNSREWWEGTNQTRYNYLYSRSELDEWMAGLSRILKKTYKTYIFFNNHPQGKAVQNADMMKNLLDAHLKNMKK
jgi:uncharacterized protein YecE (DUF72 family)